MAVSSIFPPEGVREDSRFFKKTFKDNTVESKTEGGYSYTRPRSARRPRRIFKTGFSGLTVQHEDQLMRFFQTVGTHTEFAYQVPTTGEIISVRLTGSAPTSNYVGVGGNHRYDITDVEMTEV